MKNIVTPNEHKLATKLLREVADAQPFHVDIYHEAFPFADQYLIILPSTYRNVMISLMVMTCIAFLLIPSIPSGEHIKCQLLKRGYFSCADCPLYCLHLHWSIRIYDSVGG